MAGSGRRSMRRNRTLLALLVAACLLCVTGVAHAEQVPFAATSASRAPADYPPQEAYEEALRLLGSTIKTRSSNGKAGRSANNVARSSSQQQNSESSPAASTGTERTPDSRSLSQWIKDELREAFEAGSKEGFRDILKEAGIVKGINAGKWQGAPTGAAQYETQWPSASPLPLWPDWERLPERVEPVNPTYSGWDSVMLGPFHGRSEASSDLTMSDPKDHRDSDDKNSDRRNAVALLTRAGWGRESVDWHHEAYSAAARLSSKPLQTSFKEAADKWDGSGSSALADALWVLGEYSLWGTHGSKPNLARARACYQRLVDLGHDQLGNSMAGNASAHARLAFLEGSGWESTVQGDWKPLPDEFNTWSSFTSSPTVDDVRLAWKKRRELFAQLKSDDAQRQAKAVLHYTIAADAGHAPSQMALGFRYKAGIGVAQSSWKALELYEKAAEDAYKRFQAGPPGGLTLPYTKTRVSDLHGGAYGPGASVASTGFAVLNPAVQAALHRQPGSAHDPSAPEDMLEYHIYLAEHGDVRSSLFMAQIYYHGSIYSSSEAAGAVPRDYRRSMTWLQRIAKDVWPRKAGQVRRGGPTGYTAKPGEKGEDVQLKVDDNLLGYAGSAAGMIGQMYLRGEGVKQDFARAWVWFSRGKDTGDPSSYNGLGVMLRDGLGVKADIVTATTYFETAAKVRHSGANVNLGKIHMEMGDLDSAVKCLTIASLGESRFEAVYLLAKVNAQLARKEQSSELCRKAISGFKHTAENGDWSTRIPHKAEHAWRQGDMRKALLGWALAGEMGYESAQNNIAYLLDRATSSSPLRILKSNNNINGAGNFTDRLALVHWTRSAAQSNVDAMVKMGDYYFYGIGTGNPGQPAYEKAAACYSAAADKGVSALAYWNLGWMYENGIGVARQDFHLAKRYYDMAVETNTEAYLPVALSLVKLHIRAIWAAVFRSESSQSAISLLSSYASSDRGNAAYTEAEEQAAAKQRQVEEKQKRLAEKRQQGGGYGDPNEPETWAARDGETDEDLDDMIESGLLILVLGGLAYLAYVRQNVQLQLRRERREQDNDQQQQRPEQQPQQPPAQHQPNPWAPLGNEPNAAANLLAGL